MSHLLTILALALVLALVAWLVAVWGKLRDLDEKAARARAEHEELEGRIEELEARLGGEEDEEEIREAIEACTRRLPYARQTTRLEAERYEEARRSFPASLIAGLFGFGSR